MKRVFIFLLLISPVMLKAQSRYSQEVMKALQTGIPLLGKSYDDSYQTIANSSELALYDSYVGDSLADYDFQLPGDENWINDLTLSYEPNDADNIVLYFITFSYTADQHESVKKQLAGMGIPEPKLDEFVDLSYKGSNFSFTIWYEAATEDSEAYYSIMVMNLNN